MRKRFIIGLLFLPALYFMSHEKKDPTTVSLITSERPAELSVAQPKPTPERVNFKVDPSRNISAPTSSPLPNHTNPASAKRAFVRGSVVALRDGPGKNFPILDRYDSGREIETFGVDGEWTRVRDILTQREGWISSALLSDLKPDTPKKEETKPKAEQAPSPKIPPLLSDSLIIQRLIAGSIANYPGSCPCPESRDRAGRRCGNRSAWARGGGYAPLCYANDITPAMITAFRSRQ